MVMSPRVTERSPVTIHRRAASAVISGRVFPRPTAFCFSRLSHTGYRIAAGRKFREPPILFDDPFSMKQLKQTIGMLMQLAALGLLPSIVIFQLFYGFKLIVMPISLLCGVCIFSMGTLLREWRE